VQDLVESSGVVSSFSPLANSQISLDGSNNVNVDTSSSFTKTSYYIRIYTASTSSVYASNIFVKMEIEVSNCRSATVTFVDQSNKIVRTYYRNAPTPIIISLGGYFKSSIASCSITSYAIASIKDKSTGASVSSSSI
jgi:hypothetical protein